MAAIRNSKTARPSDRHVWLAGAALALWAAAGSWFFYAHGYVLFYGDAEAHLNIARSLLDSRTPGSDQLGTVWLPLPHLLIAPFAAVDRLWRTGLAGTIPSAAAFVAGGCFLFAAAARVFESTAAAAAVALYALNPNLLYLASTAMTEPLFFAALLALLYFTARFSSTDGYGAVVLAGAAALAAALTRYEGWFLIPFTTAYIFCAVKRNRWLKAALFVALATAGPLLWLAHNWWFAGDLLDFYRGPYSPKAIQGGAYYPGWNEWGKACLYFRTAARWCAGWPLLILGAAGALVLMRRRALWPLALLLLPPVFYLWSMHSSGGSPVFVPDLWPNSYYNTRYGLTLFPAAVFAAAALVTLAPPRFRRAAAAAIVVIASATWAVHHSPEQWITWKESQVNSLARRAWTRHAAEFLAPRYRRGSGIISSFGDMTGIFRSMGLPLREVLTNNNW